MIELQDVSVSYGSSPALCGVSMRVGRGEAIALAGPNGSGKSTLLRLIVALVFPDSGKFLFDGQEITASRMRDPGSSKSFHQRVGLLFQSSDAQLFCPTVREEVAFGPRQMGLDAKAVDERVRDCLELLGIGKLASRAPHQLSEGEKRKVALASILSLNPEVLALDEPMNGLDPRTKRFLGDLLIELRDAGKTIICATHDYAYVKGVFPRVAVFSEEHRLVRTGSWEETIGDEAFLASHNLA